MKLNYLLLSISLLLFLFSCGFNAAKYYTPSEVNANKSNTPISELTAGRSKYINSCGECHKLYKPSRHNSYDWIKYLDEMQEKAEISDAEKKQIHLYLTSEISE